jgi:glutamine amidotransferase
MISIIDYGLGNVLAFRNVYERLNIPVAVARTAADFAKSTKLILPGVGAFDHAMELLDASGMRGPIEELVLQKKMPVLGICVGMQILAGSSEEGRKSGLGWVNGTVRRFRGPSLALPHMGWNDVKPAPGARLFASMENDALFYFLHSYYFDCRDSHDVLAFADYGGRFPCVVNHNNIYGVQFHPEKSHHWGGQLLKNFAEMQ